MAQGTSTVPVVSAHFRSLLGCVARGSLLQTEWLGLCLDTPVNPAKTGELIEMPLGDGGQARVGPINRVSNRWCNRASVLVPPGEYDGMICEEAAMHTIATITVATCC